MDAGTVSDTGTGLIVELPETPTRAGLAITDLVEGVGKSWLWTTLAQQDVKLRYRGSILGPFWQTLTTAVMIGGMGCIYSKLFNNDLHDYLPMLSIGLIFWTFIASMVTEGCGTFTSVQGIIQQVRLPFSLHAYRLVYRNLLALAHNFVIIPIVLLLFPHPIVWTRLIELIPALLLISVIGVWVSILLGMVSARFRDVPPIVASVVQVVFFMTPVMWPVQALGANAWWVELNPFFVAIDVLRGPQLGQPTEPHTWAILMIITAFGCAASFAFFARFRSRIAFWV